MSSWVKCAFVVVVASIRGLFDVGLALYVFIADDLPRPTWNLTETLKLAFVRGFLAQVAGSHSFNDLKPVIKLLWSSPIAGTSVKNLAIPRQKDLLTEELSYPPISLLSDIQCKLITSKTPKGNKLVIYLHGGFFVVGSVNMFVREASNLADLTGYTVLSVGYGLSPEHPFPGPLHDVLSAYFYAIKSLGFKPEDIGFYGVGSGGNLALAALLWLRDQSFPMPKAVSLMSPLLDFTECGPSRFTNALVDILPRYWTTAKDRHNGVHSYYVQKHRPDSPYVSPVFASPSTSPYIGFYGVGSGGNLALAALLWLRDQSFPMPKAVSLMSPLLDFTECGPSRFTNALVDILPRYWTTAKDRHNGVHSYYVQKHRPDSPYVSPVFASPSTSPLPSILIQVGASEALRDEAFLFAMNFDHQARDKSLPPNRISVETYTDCIHDWPYNLPGKKLSNLAVRRAVYFLEERLRDREIPRRESDVSEGASEFLLVHIKVAVEKIPQDAAAIVLNKGFEDVKSNPKLVEGSRFDWKTVRKLWKIPVTLEQKTDNSKKDN
eukprot:TRINITY_DN4955_c0_g1_i1.p1 TRINITY_DN4955_c0_g1~~TRINITY_DN4955_c0_g1_i1.p1  ORF type:complete len:549 (-),score=142.20 TRINITY_DN4955_c0_g1_i1:190-1836(-)